MFDIANVPLTQVPQEERMHYLTKAREVGYFRGYKMPKYFVRRPSQLLGLEHGLTSSWYSQHIDNGVRDQIENYSGAFQSEASSSLLLVQCPHYEPQYTSSPICRSIQTRSVHLSLRSPSSAGTVIARYYIRSSGTSSMRWTAEFSWNFVGFLRGAWSCLRIRS